MQEKFQNKYRIKSARLASWDYSWDGSYFITICSKNRELIFGEIENGEMILSPIGEIVQQEWDRSFQIRNELFCDAFILMPNHLHAIVRIENPVETHGHPAETHDHPVETHSRASLRGGPHDQKTSSSKYGVAWRPPKSISSFIAGFKSSATKRINQVRNTPGKPVWQPRFYDHIIRSEEDYNRICEYIEYNPQKWDEDRFYLKD